MLKFFSHFAALVLMASTPIVAAPVLWTLSGVTFADGGTASGSFVYDATTNTYSAINVTSAGGTLSSVNYIAPHPLAAATLPIFLPVASGNLTGVRVLVMSAASALSNAGGTVALVGAGEGICADATCSSAPPARALSGGSLIGAAVPATVPTLSEFGMALLGVLLVVTTLFALRRSGSHSAA